MKYGDLYIIPNGDQVLEKCFHREVAFDHLADIQTFVDENRLGYQFTKNDSQEAPCLLAAEGHFIIKTVDDSDILVCYIPEYVTDYQSMWVYEHEDLIKQYSMIVGFQIKHVDNVRQAIEIHGFSNILQNLKYGNLLYHQQKQKQGIMK